jgi:hypothetical protein
VTLAVPFSSAGYAVEPLPAPTGKVILTISGKITRTNASGKARLDRAMLESLGKASLTTTTSFTDGKKVFEGVPLRAVLERVGATGTLIKATALNDFETDMSTEDLRYEPLPAMTMDGALMTARDKGPIWIVYPKDNYAALQNPNQDRKWVWQLERLDIE